MESYVPIRVLSIQSHVVSGYVGNTAAVFPMQLLGFDVHVINSVQFSNHTGYPVVKGAVMNGDELDSLVDGLRRNGLCHFDYLLTGYIGSETFLNSVLRVQQLCKSVNPDIKYICDPVLGDNNKLYVPIPLINIYKSSILSEAYMITPNQLEAEYLSDMKITTESDVVDCLKKLFQMGPEVIVLTSAEVEDYPDKLCCYILSGEETMRNSGSGTHSPHRFRHGFVEISRVIVNKLTDFRYTGTGDVLCALLLSWVHKFTNPPSTDGSDTSSSADKNSMESQNESVFIKASTRSCGRRNTYSHACGCALRCAIASIQAILRRAQSNAVQLAKQRDEADGEDALAGLRCKHVELPIIQSKSDIENPPMNGIEEVHSWVIDV